MSNKTLTLLLVLAFVLVPGCAKVPSEVIATSDAAFTALDGVQADIYASTELERAQAALAAARTELETQNAKSTMSRKYVETERLFREAQLLAEEASTAAESGRAAAQQAADEYLALVRLRLEESEFLLGQLEGCPTRSKGLVSDTALLRGRFDGFAASVPALETRISETDFIGAQIEAEGLVSEIDEMSGEITLALEQLGCAASTT